MTATVPTVLASGATGIIQAADYGVDKANSDNSAQLQAALDAARASQPGTFKMVTVQLPDGNIGIGNGMTDGFDLGFKAAGAPNIQLRGAGMDATRLVWKQSNDLGLGKYAFDCFNWGTAQQALMDLSIIGPGISSSTLGRPPGKAGGGYVGMHGVRLNGGRMERCNIQDFNYGITLYRSHCKLTDVLCGSCYFAVYIDSDGAIANNGYERCLFTGNTMACVAMSKSNGILADNMTDCHLGYSPFGIYQVNTNPSISNPLMMLSTVFTAVAFESIGHSAICSEDRTGNCANNAWNAVTASGVPDTNFRISTISITGVSTTSGSAVVTCSSTNGLNVGMPVVGSGIPATTSAVIKSIDSTTQFTLWTNATATASGLTLTVDYRKDYAISVGNWSGNKMYGLPDLYTNCAGTDGSTDAGTFTDNECDALGLSGMWVSTTKHFLSKTRITGCATANGSPNVSCDSTAKLRVGTVVIGTGVNANVLSITDATNFVLTGNATASNTGLTLVNRFSSISVSGGATNRFRSNGTQGRIELAGATITKGQLLQYGGSGGFWVVQPYDHTASKKCIGLAANDALMGEFVGVYDRGLVTGLPDASFSNNGFGDPLKPSTTDDGKFTNGTFGTNQIIGFIRNGNTIDLSV